LNLLGVQEIDLSESMEINGGISPWWSVASIIIEATVQAMSSLAEAYINYSMETEGKYVIHHAY